MKLQAVYYRVLTRTCVHSECQAEHDTLLPDDLPRYRSFSASDELSSRLSDGW